MLSPSASPLLFGIDPLRPQRSFSFGTFVRPNMAERRAMIVRMKGLCSVMVLHSVKFGRTKVLHSVKQDQTKAFRSVLFGRTVLEGREYWGPVPEGAEGWCRRVGRRRERVGIGEPGVLGESWCRGAEGASEESWCRRVGEGCWGRKRRRKGGEQCREGDGVGEEMGRRRPRRTLLGRGGDEGSIGKGERRRPERRV